MKLKMVTTITSYVDVDTLATDHEVSVEAPDIPSEQIAKAVLIGAAKSILRNLGEEDEASSNMRSGQETP